MRLHQCPHRPSEDSAPAGSVNVNRSTPSQHYPCHHCHRRKHHRGKSGLLRPLKAAPEKGAFNPGGPFFAKSRPLTTKDVSRYPPHLYERNLKIAVLARTIIAGANPPVP